MAPTPEEDVVKMAPISRIVEVPEIQIRASLSPATVAEYQEIIKEHRIMDPMVCFVESIERIREVPWILSQGHHRLQAYRNCATEKAPVKFLVGTQSDALEYAMKTGGRASLPLDNASKRRAAELAVADSRIGQYDDAKIAKMIGVSASLVNLVRRGIAVPSERPFVEIPQSTTNGGVGPGGTESPAPPSSRSRERKPADDKRPTKAMVLRQIDDYLKHSVIDEDDLIKLMESKKESYFWMRKPGEPTVLRVVGRSGRVQIEVPVVVREVGCEVVSFKYEEGKLLSEERAGE